jgi:hypothetical protein
MIARQTVIEGNNATGSSIIAGGNGLNFAQHVYMARNSIRNVRGNDREVVTYDAEGAQYAGAPLSLNATHVTAPNCPGRMDSRFHDTDNYNSAPPGGVIAILDGPGAGLHRRIVAWGAEGAPTNYDTAPCWWRIDQPFPSSLLSAANHSEITLVVTFFAGRSLFADNVFEDTGHFQLYHSGIDNVIRGHQLARTGGMWVGGMAVGMRHYLNNSAGALVPNPCLNNEFIHNTVSVGHRAPHACDPSNMTRESFWACGGGGGHQMFSFGMDGQGQGTNMFANRFQVFSGNNITGANGILMWGLGNSDALVSGNSFQQCEIPVGADQFPIGVDAVHNYVLHGNHVSNVAFA